MTDSNRKIKNWEVPIVLRRVQFVSHQAFSPRAYNCLFEMKIERFEDVVVPDVWFASTKPWTTLMLSRPNLGRRAYQEIVAYLIERGLTPVYVDDEHSMTGEFMR